MTRTDARELAVQLTFMSDFTDEASEQLLERLFQGAYYRTLAAEFRLFEEFPNKKQKTYICNLVNGVAAHRAEFDENISRYSIGWRLDRISPLCKAVMRVAMYEMLFVEDVPDSVAIHEAVELARRYEDEDAVAFVNGLLGAFVRGVRG